MDTDKRVAPLTVCFLLLCNTRDISSFAAQNSKQTVEGCTTFISVHGSRKIYLKVTKNFSRLLQRSLCFLDYRHHHCGHSRNFKWREAASGPWLRFHRRPGKLDRFTVTENISQSMKRVNFLLKDRLLKGVLTLLYRHNYL